MDQISHNFIVFSLFSPQTPYTPIAAYPLSQHLPFDALEGEGRAGSPQMNMKHIELVCEDAVMQKLGHLESWNIKQRF